jgi:hypothetical protein
LPIISVSYEPSKDDMAYDTDTASKAKADLIFFQGRDSSGFDMALANESEILVMSVSVGVGVWGLSRESSSFCADG